MLWRVLLPWQPHRSVGCETVVVGAVVPVGDVHQMFGLGDTSFHLVDDAQHVVKLELVVLECLIVLLCKTVQALCGLDESEC